MDCVTSRKTLKALRNRMKRKATKLDKTLAENKPGDLDLAVLSQDLTQLQTMQTEYEEASSQMMEAEVDEGLLAHDTTEYEAFDEEMNEAMKTCNMLQAWKTVQYSTMGLDSSTISLNDMYMKQPESDFSGVMARLDQEIRLVKNCLRGSRLEADHPLYLQAMDTVSRANLLTVKVGVPHPPDSKATLKKATSGYKRAPRQVPTFSGNLRDWHTFWTCYKLAVHDAVDLEPGIKLSYLKESMKDKALQRTLTRFSEGPDAYDQAVKELQSHFNKPKHMHRLYLKNVTTLSPVKAIQSELTAFVDTVQETPDGLRRLKQVDLEYVLTSLCSEFLPEKIRLAWEDSTESCRTVAPVTELLDFVRRKADNPLYMDRSRGSGHQEKSGQLEKRPAVKTRGSAHVAVTAAPSAPPTQQSAGQQQSGGGSRSSSNRSRGSSQQSSRYTCPLCQEQHYCFACSNFRKMSVQQRKSHVSTHSLCVLCLKTSHSPDECKGNFSCRVCNGPHNTLLHLNDSGAVTVSGTANVVATEANGSLSSNKLLMTCQVLATGPTGKAMPIRGLLDSGADISAVTTQVARQLGLRKLNTTVSVSSYGGVVQPASPSVSLTIESIHAKPWHTSLEAVVIDKITETIPRSKATSVREHPSLQGVQLADPHFDLPGRVDLLLGVDVLPQILQSSVCSGTLGVWQTTLGHAVMGTYQDPPKAGSCSAAVVQVALQAESPGQSPDGLELQRFWEVEQPSIQVAPFTKEELEIQDQYQNTHSFNAELGKYHVLPRNSKGLVLGESRSRAMKRFLSNEKALVSKGKYAQFQAVVKEYLDLGHAQLLAEDDFKVPTPLTYYLPMHGVYKAGSSTTKLRVVFDASAPSAGSVSLNQTLGIGPTLHPPLDQILLKFRTYKVALTADIKGMYREILLDSADKHYHRFLWRANQGDPIEDFKMNRLTFGVAASPYIAVGTLQQVAHDHGQDLPLVSEHMRTSFYVDDLMAGAESVVGALGLYRGLVDVLAKGGFLLRKFRSSHAAVLAGISTDLQEPMPSLDLVDLHSSSYPKALGLSWDSRSDRMFTAVQMPGVFQSTKRGIIADVAKTFDVLGWITPVIISMKILFQSLWQLKLEWEDAVPAHLKEQHIKWREELPLLSSIQVPRYYFSEESPLTIQLHGFCDASQRAYAAVIYIRATYASLPPSCQLVVAKSRVAPLKVLTIPRLELSGAVLLAELMHSTMTTLDVDVKDVTCWSDSTIVLCWLRSGSRHL